MQDMILASGELCHNFTRCVILFADYIQQDKISSIHEVATMGTDDSSQDTLRNEQYKQDRDRGF